MPNLNIKRKTLKKKTKGHKWSKPPNTTGMSPADKEDAVRDWYKVNNAQMPWNQSCCFCESKLSDFPDDFGHSILPIPDASPSISHRARKHPDYGYRACTSCNYTRVIPVRMCVGRDGSYFDADGYICDADGNRFV